MSIVARIGMLIAVVSLVGALGQGCSKSEPGAGEAVSSATDVAGLAKETLLVLKFHHDN